LYTGADCTPEQDPQKKPDPPGDTQSLTNWRVEIFNELDKQPGQKQLKAFHYEPISISSEPLVRKTMNAINNGPSSLLLQPSSAITTSDSSESVDGEDGHTAAQKSAETGVSISAEAKSKLIEDHYNVDDIDASSLPTGIKKYLSAIRDIQGRIGEKLRALQRVMQDQTLSPAERKSRINQAQFEVSMLNNVLFTVTSGMQQLEMQMKIQLSDLTLIGSLMKPR
jgi:hypothetical protein